MRHPILKSILLGLALLGYGCRAESPVPGAAELPTGNSEMQQRLLGELDKKRIWYNVVGDARIEVRNDDSLVVAELLDAIVKSTLPPERAISPASHVFDQLAERLGSIGVECESVVAFDRNWLVCSEKDMHVVDDELHKLVTTSN